MRHPQAADVCSPCTDTCVDIAQEQFRQSERIAGDLVLITGSGQHSAGSPVLRSSVQRLLASLQLAPDEAEPADSSAGGGSSEPTQSGVAFPGFTRFTGRRQPPQCDEAPAPAAAAAADQQQSPLVDTGLRPRHGGFGGVQELAGELGGGMQWAQALTEAIILDWCASSRYAWTSLAGAGAGAAAHDGSSGGGGPQAPAPANTAWMDAAIQHGWRAAAVPAAGDAAAPAAQMEATRDGPPGDAAAQEQAAQPRSRSQRDARNAGRLVVANETLLRWLRSKAHRGSENE